MRLLLVLPLLLALAACRPDGPAGPRPSGTPAATPEADTPADSLLLRSFQAVPGTTIMRGTLALVDERRSRLENYSASGGRYTPEYVVNQLFHDLDTGASRWLVPGTAQQFLATRPLTDPADSTRLAAFFYEVVTDDTDGDEALTAEDDRTLAFSAPDGTGYLVAAERVTRFEGPRFLEDGRIALFATQSDGAVRSVLLAPDASAVVRDTLLPARP